MSRKKIDVKAHNKLPVIAENGLMTPHQRKSLNAWLSDANLRVIENDELFKKLLERGGFAKGKFYSKITKVNNAVRIENERLEKEAKANGGKFTPLVPEPVGIFTLNEIDCLLTIYNEDRKIKAEEVSNAKADGTKDKMTDKERERMAKARQAMTED